MKTGILTSTLLAAVFCLTPAAQAAGTVTQKNGGSSPTARNAHVGTAATCFGRTATLVGTSADEIIVGTAEADVIVTGGGNDTVMAGSGEDTICDLDGNSLLDGGSADDVISAGAGDDTLSGGDGYDRLMGGGGNDRLLGGADSDVLYGETGDDTLIPSLGDDLIDGGEGHDLLTLSDLSAGVRFHGSSGIFSGASTARMERPYVEQLRLTAYDDQAVVLAGMSVEAGAGADMLTVLGGRALGGEGDDTLDARRAATPSVLYGEGGADKLFAANGLTDAVINCGTETDSAQVDAAELTTDCESAPQVQDACSNMLGAQAQAPTGFIRSGSICRLKKQPQPTIAAQQVPSCGKTIASACIVRAKVRLLVRGSLGTTLGAAKGRLIVQKKVGSSWRTIMTRPTMRSGAGRWSSSIRASARGLYRVRISVATANKTINTRSVPIYMRVR